MNCRRKDCGHLDSVHQDAGTHACRVTGCGCQEFLAAPAAAGQRVCVDVPPGFAVTFQLMPLAGEAEEAGA